MVKRFSRIDRYWLLVLPLAAAIILLYLLPLARVFALSVSDPEPGLGNFMLIAASPSARNILWTTFRICAITTLVSLVLGYAVAYTMANAGPRHQQIIIAMVLMPFWISVLVRAFSWLVLLRHNGLVNETLLALDLVAQPVPLVRNELGVLIGMVHYMIPYAVFPLFATMRHIDAQLLRASRSLGAGPIRTFFHVYFPLSLPGVTAGGLLVFVFSLGFFVTPAILGGGKIVMLSEYVSLNILHTLRWGFAAAQAVILLVATFLLIGAMSRSLTPKKVLSV
jgi:putative spermidine/putrescine transport system permease protein